SQSRMTAALDSLRVRTDESLEEMSRHNENDHTNIAAAKRIIGSTAEAMENYVARMNVELPIFSDALQAAFGATGKIGAISAESWPSEKERIVSLLDQVSSFHASLSSIHGVTQSLRDTIARTPRMTSHLNKARRRTVAVLESLIGELS